MTKTTDLLLSHQSLEEGLLGDVSAQSVMSDKLKTKQKEVQKTLKTLDKELKHR